jgi:hypothetical protein
MRTTRRMRGMRPMRRRRMGVSTRTGLSRMRVSRTGVSTRMGPSTGSYF